MSESIASLLKTISYFSRLEASVLKELSQAAKPYDVLANETVFAEGELSKGLYIVESGWLKAVKLAASGREQVLRFFSAGETVHEVGLFVETPNPANLIALEPSRLYLLPREVMLSLMDEQPRLLRLVTQALAKRLLHVVSLVEDLSLLPVEARLARFLLMSATEGTFQRQKWATQAELSSRLGTVPDVLSRTMKSFADEGLIEVSRQRIEILNKQGLQVKARQF